MGDEQLPIVLFKKADESDAKWDELCKKTIIIGDLTSEESQVKWQKTSSITLDYEITTQEWYQVKKQLFKFRIPRKLKKRLKKMFRQLSYVANATSRAKVKKCIQLVKAYQNTPMFKKH